MSAYTELLERVRQIGRLHGIEALLEWDQETYMPPAGIQARADQSALLAGIAHERLVDERTQQLLEAAQAEGGDAFAQVNLRETRRTLERALKLPQALVEAIARTAALVRNEWARAREADRFEMFAPHLARMLELKREVAERIGYQTEPYDALMDEYEPGARSAEIETLFAGLRQATVSLLDRLMNVPAPQRPDPSILSRHYPRVRQERWSRRMAEAVGFDFNAGRADVSVHPFCTTVGGSGDVRVTTRYLEEFLPSAMFGTLHEVGHGMYEQGFDPEHAFTPMSDAVSLGIHESQSRLWENLVGRSREFWSYHYADLQELFPEALQDVSLDDFYRAINTVQPSLIRVEADELTYNLHIVLRFELERALLSGKLRIDEVPAAWNDKMQSMLGITPPSNRDGCLQDIHWSIGIFGYFPTYALGNLYAAQFFEAARADVPDLPGHIASNEHRPLLDWLRQKIHRHGRRYRAHELVEQVTGRPLSIDAFVRHVNRKFSDVYRLSGSGAQP